MSRVEAGLIVVLSTHHRMESSMNFQCKKCDHVFGAEWPEQPIVEAHYREAHGATGRVYAI